MNPRFCLLLLILFALPGLAQSASFLDRSLSQLDRHGLSLSFQFSTDTLAGSRVNSTAPNAASFEFLDLSSALDLGHLSPHFTGTHIFTSLHVNGIYAADFGGAVQSFSGIMSDPGVHLAEFWVERDFTKSARLRFGKIDANPDFAFVESGIGFVNSSLGYDPTFITLPNYSDTNWGGELLLHRGHFRANLAAFVPDEGTGPLLMEEIGAGWQPAKWKGRIALGAWQRTGKMLSLSGSEQSGSRGIYFVGEQKLWRNEPRRGKPQQSLAAFLQLGAAPEDFSTFTRHIGAGLVWEAPFSLRENDSAGIALSRGRFTSNPAAAFDRSYETIFEAYYRWQLFKQLSVSPDFQYALNPGGLRSNRNTFALGLRTIFTLSSREE